MYLKGLCYSFHSTVNILHELEGMCHKAWSAVCLHEDADNTNINGKMQDNSVITEKGKSRAHVYCLWGAIV